MKSILKIVVPNRLKENDKTIYVNKHEFKVAIKKKEVGRFKVIMGIFLQLSFLKPV